MKDTMAELLCDVHQLLTGWHSDGTAWTAWDESVRDRVMKMQKRLETKPIEFHCKEFQDMPVGLQNALMQMAQGVAAALERGWKPGLSKNAGSSTVGGVSTPKSSSLSAPSETKEEGKDL